MIILAAIRKARLSGVCALALTCACVPAMARQSSTSDSSAKKPVTAKTTTRKRHTSTAQAKSGGAAKSTSTMASSKRSSRKKKSRRTRGQQKIDSERARSIQEALIREHYLSGEATGTWNQSSEDAMRRYQADHGWQSKEVPDSRALIKLGLGPSKDHLLNPESAMTTGPDAPRAQSLPPASHTSPNTADPTPTPTRPPSDSASPQ